MPRRYKNYDYDYFAYVDNPARRPPSLKPKDRIIIHESGEEIMRQVTEQAISFARQGNARLKTNQGQEPIEKFHG